MEEIAQTRNRPSGPNAPYYQSGENITWIKVRKLAKITPNTGDRKWIKSPSWANRVKSLQITRGLVDDISQIGENLSPIMPTPG